jgi:hypothetical protein
VVQQLVAARGERETPDGREAKRFGFSSFPDRLLPDDFAVVDSIVPST